MFKTHEEAIQYAKQHPGAVIQRDPKGKGYIIKKQAHTKINLRALLLDTKKELNYLVACILQRDVKTTYSMTNKAGEILASKLAGLGVSGGVVGLVSTFGTAGTGTAISTLSGAAASNATLAWIGGIIGGGMFAGAILTTALAMGSGWAAYKLFKSKPREYENLDKIDREIIDKSIILIRAIDEMIQDVQIPNHDIVKNFGKNDIMELYKLVKNHKNEIKQKLDKRNQLAFTLKSLPHLDKIIIRYSEL